MIRDMETLGTKVAGLPRVPNFRDLGGHLTRSGGTVRRGLAFRAGELGRLDGPDRRAIARLGIRTVYDLRTEDERRVQPERDRLPTSVAYVVADVLADAPEGNPAQVMGLLERPDELRAAFGAGRAAAIFTTRYRQFVGLASARAAYGRLFTGLAEEERRPALFHCTTGKDRTGWAAAALLLLLGVPDDLVMADFLRSNRELAPTFRPWLDRFAAGGGDPGLLEPMMVARPEYLEAALEEVGRTFGTIEGYFAAGLGIGAVGQARLRAAFVAPA